MRSATYRQPKIFLGALVQLSRVRSTDSPTGEFKSAVVEGYIGLCIMKIVHVPLIFVIGQWKGLGDSKGKADHARMGVGGVLIFLTLAVSRRWINH